MKVLILTGKFGMGHYQAAQTIKAQLEEQLGNVETLVVDLINYILEEYSVSLYRAYGTLVNRTSGAFNWLYKATEKGEWQGRLPMERTMARAVAELAAETHADMIIATHSCSVMAASSYKRRYKSQLPLVTCVTDIVCHANWITPETDWYLVASDYSRDLLLQRGVAAERVLVSGIPVKPVFKRIAKAHGRRGGDKQLLIMGGGCGLLPKERSFYEALDALAGVHTTILTGGNRNLLAQLDGRYARITALGFTDEVPQLMAQADVVVSKPGGLSVFEAINAEKPLLLFPPKLEQEKRNGAFMADSGMARVLSPGAMAREIGQAVSDEVGLKRMARQMRVFKSSLDQQAVVKLVAGYERKGLVQC